MTVSETDVALFKESKVDIIKRFLPVALIVVIWCYFGSNILMDPYDYIMMNVTFSVLLVALSAYSLNEGSKKIGLFGPVIGLILYYVPIAILYSGLLLQYEILVAINITNLVGASITLFSSVALGLWLSHSVFTVENRTIRFNALLFNFVIILVWVIVSTITLFEASPVFPGLEIFFYIALILTTSLSIPRRQYIALFFIFIGIAVTLAGLLILTRAVTLDSVFLGFYLRLFGTVLAVLFALPLGASSISARRSPMNGIYITATAWFFAELILAVSIFPFSPVRVIAVAALIIVSFRSGSKIRPTLLAFVMLISAALAIFGNSILISAQASTLPMLLTYAGLGLAVVSSTFLVFSVISLAESIRVKSEGNQLIVGITLIIIGIIAGFSALTILVQWAFLLDLISLILIIFGSEFIFIKPHRADLWIFIVVILFAANAVISPVLYFFQAAYYPSLALMIFFCVQYFRKELKEELSTSPQ